MTPNFDGMRLDSIRAWFRERGYEIQGFVRLGECFASASRIDDPPNEIGMGGRFNSHPSCRTLTECFTNLAEQMESNDG